MNSTIDALEAARWALSHNYAPIPVPAASKRPSREGWPTLKLKTEDLQDHFSATTNVGLILGAPSGGLVDVDVDCGEAVSIAARFLPDTSMRHGRPGKRSSHYWYVAPGLTKTVQYKDVDGGMLAEIRSTGAQTLIPPSCHPCGERYGWEEQGAPTRVDSADLERAVRSLCACALISRHWPASGSRHDAALALAGALVQGGLSDDLAPRILGAVAAAASDEQVEDRIRAARDTATAFAKGEPVTGRARLAELLGEKVVARVELWLELERVRSEGNREPKTSRTALMIAIGGQAELFATPDGDTYAAIQCDDHRETWGLRAKGFKAWLRGRLYDEHGVAASGESIAEATATLDAMARSGRTVHDVYTRIARVDQSIFVDLGDSAWTTVRITPSGWELVRDQPVRFRRPHGMLPLAEPVHGSSLSALRPLVNVRGDEDWALLLTWLVGTLRGRPPYPVLSLSGEHGSAKSTLARILRAVIDPNKAPIRSPPRDERDLIIAAINSCLIALDNISGIPVWMSDTLCRLATGGGYATRELYADAEETILEAARPIVLTGIGESVARADLLDRTISIVLEPIPPRKRCTEAALWAELRRLLPGVIGAVYDAVVRALREEPTTELAEYPRMADFARWAVAAEPSLGLPPGSFLSAYAGSRMNAHQAVLEDAVIAAPLLALLEAERTWQGTAGDLLEALTARANEVARARPDWPQGPRALSGALQRIAPALRSRGFDVQKQRARDRVRSRTIVINPVDRFERSSTSSEPSEPSEPRKILGSTCSATSSAGHPDERPRQAVPPRADHCADDGVRSSDRREVPASARKIIKSDGSDRSDDLPGPLAAVLHSAGPQLAGMSSEALGRVSGVLRLLEGEFPNIIVRDVRLPRPGDVNRAS